MSPAPYLAVLAAGIGSCAPGDVPDPPARVLVFAAASTADVIEEAARRFQVKNGVDVVVSFDASSNLARQIEAGAPADVYVSANVTWMDSLEAAGAVVPGTRRDLLANELVLIAPAGRGFDVEMTAAFDLRGRLPQRARIAVGDPAHVPAGLYARQALEALGWWEAVEPLLVATPHARAALRLVELGEADAGIVYATDAVRSDAVEILAPIPAGLHDPIRYPVARCTGSGAAAAFLEFLESSEMRSVFEAAGFRVLSPPGGSD